MGVATWWQALLGRGPAVDEQRWVVLDVETSGLDPTRARLLAIAAIAVRVDWPAGRMAIDIGDSFEVVLGQDQVSSRDNILLHGIGEQRQRDGLPIADGMQAFARFVGHSPLLAFHSAFDETLISRYSREHLGAPLPNPWVDIEQLCAVTHPQSRARALDDWMTQFGIACAQRHQAAADTLAECEVLARIWPLVARECRSWREVRRLADRHRWVARG
jgi:DNA polymerase III subunit epsilon